MCGTFIKTSNTKLTVYNFKDDGFWDFNIYLDKKKLKHNYYIINLLI